MTGTRIVEAVSCGRYDCGHVGRSDSATLRRAAYLYLLQGEIGMRRAVPRDEPAEVLAALTAMKAGVSCEAIRDAATGRFVPAAEAVVIRESAIRITRGQREVLKRVAQGMSITEIADELFLAVATIKSHLLYASRNLGTHSALDAAVKATRLGLLADEEGE